MAGFPGPMDNPSNEIETETETETEIETETDRRGADRFCTVCRIAKIEREGDAGLWRVRNISDRGMMLSAEVPVELGERLEIALSENVILTGHVVWAEKGRCGVAFDEEVDGAGLLKQLAAEQREGGYRAPRLPVRVKATASTDDATIPIQLVDLSQSGAGFIHDGRFEAGMVLKLVLEGGFKRQAIVRWSRNGRGGLWLTEPLDRTDLESIRRLEG